MKINVQQAPIRNANTIGAFVYSHSGEFAAVYSDLELTGRGLSFQFTRSYRSSLADRTGNLGRGWSASIAKKIAREGDDIIYHNGAGEAYKFLRDRQSNYQSPVGFYGILRQEKKQFLLKQRYGKTYRFEVPEQGGRIVTIGDRNQNVIQFSYSAKRILITDTLKRIIAISINKGLLTELKDHAGRIWKYTYDNDGRLIEVTQPSTADFPNGTSVRYAYDTNHRLVSVTDAKGQQYLTNHYDEFGKVITQEHGAGVFKMEYEAIGEAENEFPIYRTTCLRKNGSTLLLEHNSIGNVLSRTLQVRKESFAEEDRKGSTGDFVPLVTNSAYNKNSELTSRIFPAGNKTKWVYSEDEKNPLNQGNLSQITEIPQTGVQSDQTKLVTGYESEPKFQLTTKLIDPKGSETFYEYDDNGNLTVTTYPSVTIQPVNSGPARPVQVTRIRKDKYHYNSMGQLVSRQHIDGSVTEYYYYPIGDPIGRGGVKTATNNYDKVCGYLARVVRDANGKRIKNEYAYDTFGNAATVLDGKSNPVNVRYNAMGRVESVTSRAPFTYRINYKYDANYNEIESAQSFERLEYDETNQTTIVKSSTLRELAEYDALDHVILRKIIGDDKTITERFIRDADERIIRQVQPLGNVTEYICDERNLLITKQFGVGTRETFSNRYTYNLNGAIRTSTDGNGQSITHHYDGFHRYKGFTNPVGAKKTQWFDPAGNVVRVVIDGDKGPVELGAGTVDAVSGQLAEANYYFDQWNRAYRVDQAWNDYSHEHSLGVSKWNSEKGTISTLLEYAENGLPGKVWTETGNVVSFEYDGIGRLVRAQDLTGEEFSFEYDENNNPTLVKQLGPEVEGRRFERVLRTKHDEMDRLTWQQENDEAPERFAYNALGNVTSYVGKSGIELHYTDDSLGRREGHAFTIMDAFDKTRAQIVRRFEYDDNYRLSAYTDAAGNRTVYRYDMLDRQIGVDFPDGNAAHVEYDAGGNIVRLVDQNNNEITNRYDGSNRLVARRSHIKNSDKTMVEQYEYDGLSRMVAATAPDSVIRRTYDSLSRMLTEQQGDHVLRCTHDSAGNLTSLIYPGGEEVEKAYDIRNRVTSVGNREGETIARFVYRANDQTSKMMLGKVIEADFAYNQEERLESIEYRSIDDHKLLEGFRYQYDDSGRMTNEIQLMVGPTYGDRYYHDNANRAARAQYGVQDVFDPKSSFEQETSYEHFAEGSWKRRIDADGQGHIIDDQIGTMNQLNNYEHFGKVPFAYDASGNCVQKGKSNPGHCDYAYDEYNRLVKAECYDARGSRIQTIEYFYDARGRQIRKLVTNKKGGTTDYGYVWAGGLLIEEYENEVLVRTYIYGVGSTPVKLAVNNGGRLDFYYTHNGKGLASGLVNARDPYAFAERYGYELTGASRITEIGGVAVPGLSGNSINHGLANSILSGGYLKDFHNGTDSRMGVHFSREIDAALNSGKGHHVGSGGNGTSALGKQFNDFLNMTGRGGHGRSPIGVGKHGGAPPGVQLGFRAPNQSLYGQKAGPNLFPDNLPTAPAYSEKPPQPSTKPASDFERGVTGAVNKFTDFFVTSPYLEPVVKGCSEGYLPVVGPAGANPAGSSPPPATPPGTNPTPVPPPATQKAAEEKAAEEKAEKEEKEKEEKQKEEEAKKTKAKDEKKSAGMVDPSADSGGGSVEFPSPQQVEAMFMKNKQPLNPNSGIGSSGIDTSSAPSHRPGGLDPTIALYDGPRGTGGVSASGETGFNLPLIGGGYTDTVRGWTPFAPELDPSGSGGNPVA